MMTRKERLLKELLEDVEELKRWFVWHLSNCTIFQQDYYCDRYHEDLRQLGRKAREDGLSEEDLPEDDYILDGFKSSF